MEEEKEYLEYLKEEKKRKKRKIALIISCSFVGVVLLVFGYLWLVTPRVDVHFPGNGGRKPIIYLYPTEETDVTVTLGYPDNITCSYPKYEDGWKVSAKPNGDLTYLETGRSLYSLYYECQNAVNFGINKEGFVIAGSDTAAFLEEKLAILGLNEREAEEFIIYWLPKLEENNYNYFYFATEEEINANMPLDFSVEPDSCIRVFMVFKGLDKPFDVTEQELTTPAREGFVAVEWGATELK